MTQDPINILDELQRAFLDRRRLLEQRTDAKNALLIIQKQLNEKNSEVDGLSIQIETIEQKIAELAAKLSNK